MGLVRALFVFLASHKKVAGILRALLVTIGLLVSLEAVCAGPTSPRLLLVKDPARLGWQPIVRIDHYQLAAQAIESAKEG